MAVDKLVDSTQLNADLTSIANAIRAKSGTSNSLLFPSGFINAVNAIESGGGDGYVWQDTDGYVHLSDEPRPQMVVEPLSATQNGTYTAQTGHAYSPVTVNVSGSETVEKSDVNFYDYDGALLHSFTTAEVNESGFTMPSNPSHTGLTAQGWNYTLAEMKAEVTAHGRCDVGQMYVPSDNATRIYIHLERGRTSPFLGICPDGTVTVDWGDGSATSTLTGTSTSTLVSVQHTYAPGDYVIKLTASSGTQYGIIGTTNATNLLANVSNTSLNNYSVVYSNSIKRVELSTAAIIGQYAFTRCCSLKSITLPQGILSIDDYAFYYCYHMASIIIPSGVTTINTYAFQYCQSLYCVSLPESVTTIGRNAFSYCQSLDSVLLPSQIKDITEQALFAYCTGLYRIDFPSNLISLSGGVTFDYCFGLASVVIPSSVTSISFNTFRFCYGLGEIHFKSTIPPTVFGSGSYILNVGSTECKIYVPAGTLSAYTSASRYPPSSTYTYIEE